MSALKLFQNKKVRLYYDEIQGNWYFSVINTVSILTDSSIPKHHWSDLKKNLVKEGSQLYDFFVQLKSVAADGKRYATDCLKTADLFRLIQSMPSPKTEPFKLWLVLPLRN